MTVWESLLGAAAFVIGSGAQAALDDGDYTLAIRPHHVSAMPVAGAFIKLCRSGAKRRNGQSLRLRVVFCQQFPRAFFVRLKCLSGITLSGCRCLVLLKKEFVG